MSVEKANFVQLETEPFLYANGFQPFNMEGAGYGFLVSPGALRTENNVDDLRITEATNVSLGDSGVNGLDIGTPTPNTWYALFVIGSTQGSLKPAFLFSLSATNPVLPSNIFGGARGSYDVVRQIAWVYTNAAVGMEVASYTGSGNMRTLSWLSRRPVGVGLVQPWTVTDASAVLPPNTVRVTGEVQFSNPAAVGAGNTTSLSGPTDPIANYPVNMNPIVAGVEQIFGYELILNDPGSGVIVGSDQMGILAVEASDVYVSTVSYPI